MDYPLSGTLKVERLESQIILQVLEATKPKGINRIDKLGYSHLCIHIKMTNMAPSWESYVDKVSDYSGGNAYSYFKILIILETTYLDKINFLVLLC